MKANVTINSRSFPNYAPLNGYQIRDGAYALDIDPDQKRAVIDLCLEGWIRKRRELFNIPDLAEHVMVMTPDQSKQFAKLVASRQAYDSTLSKFPVSPLLGAAAAVVSSYVAGRIAEAAVATNGIAGLVIIYRNEKNMRGFFGLISEAPIIELLCSIIPIEKILRDDSVGERGDSTTGALGHGT